MRTADLCQPCPCPIGDHIAEPRLPELAQHAAAPASKCARAAAAPPMVAPGPPRSRCAERACASAAGAQITTLILDQVAAPLAARGQAASAQRGEAGRGSSSPRCAHMPQQAARQPRLPASALPTQPAPPRARSRPLPPSRPHTRLDSCGCRRACPRRQPLGLAACARCGRFAPSLYPWPHRARTAIERQRRGGRCAPRTARRGVCRACLPDARAALAVCRHTCAPSTRDRRGRRAAGAEPALGGHPHGRRPVASSGARRRGGHCPAPPLRARLRRRYQQGVRLARGPVRLRARGRGAARLSLRPSAQPRVPLLERGIRALAQTQAAILHSSKSGNMRCPCPGMIHVLSCDRVRVCSAMSLAGCSLVSSLRHAPAAPGDHARTACCPAHCEARAPVSGAGRALTRRTPSARAARTAASLSSRRAWSSAASRCSAAASASARASARAW
jgi:hypothetical protein